MADQSIQRRLAAVLAADVVGYTRLMEEDSDGTVKAWRAARDEVIEPTIADHSGRMVKLTGDGFLAEFLTVMDAVRCAVAMQAALGKESPLDFRMGINLGDIIDDGRDIHGEGVNVAARIEALANPGGICITGDVYNQVRNRIDADYEDIGAQQVKNVSAPVRTYRIEIPDRPVNRSLEWPNRSGDGELRDSEIPTIAVMPFKNLGSDPGYDYLADGIRLAIQASLVRISGVFLVSPSGVAGYRNLGVDRDKVARELGVRYVLEGAVQQSGQRLRVTVDLTDTKVGQIVWAERYDGDLADVLATQDDITIKVVSTLNTKLVTGGNPEELSTKISKLDAALSFYRGVGHFYAMSKEDNAEAKKLFENVIRIEPGTGTGEAWLCSCHWLDVAMGWADSRDVSIAAAKEWAEKSLAVGCSDGLAEMVLAAIHLMSRRYEQALASCRQAIALRPSCPATNGIGANVLHYCGSSAEAVERMKRAISVSPVYPRWYLTILAAAYREAGDVENSISTAERARGIEPADVATLAVLCSDYAKIGQQETANHIADEIVRLEPDFSISRFLDSQPYNDHETVSRLTQDLRAAGLPD